MHNFSVLLACLTLFPITKTRLDQNEVQISLQSTAFKGFIGKQSWQKRQQTQTAAIMFFTELKVFHILSAN